MKTAHPVSFEMAALDEAMASVASKASAEPLLASAAVSAEESAEESAEVWTAARHEFLQLAVFRENGPALPCFGPRHKYTLLVVARLSVARRAHALRYFRQLGELAFAKDVQSAAPRGAPLSRASGFRSSAARDRARFFCVGSSVVDHRFGSKSFRDLQFLN